MAKDILDVYKRQRESGVRQLEREIAALCRKAAMAIVSGEYKRVSVNGDNLEQLLGVVKYQPEKLEREPQVGLVNGLAWTSVGGELLEVEASVMEGTGKIMPTGNLGDVTVSYTHLTITAEDIDGEMKPLITRATRQVVVERPAQKGDTVVIDFEGFKDGVAFEGGKAEQYPLELGSGSFIPGFEDQLEGVSAGEEKDVNVTFPEDYGAADLAGAAVVFKVKVHEVKESQEMCIRDSL